MLLLLVELLIFTALVQGSSDCTPRQISDGTRCYYLSDQKDDFESAKEFCEDMGLELSTVTDDDNNNFILNSAHDKYYNFGAGIWIGYEKTPNGWKWVDGSACGYENWARCKKMWQYSDTLKSGIIYSTSNDTLKSRIIYSPPNDNNKDNNNNRKNHPKHLMTTTNQVPSTSSEGPKTSTKLPIFQKAHNVKYPNPRHFIGQVLIAMEMHSTPERLIMLHHKFCLAMDHRTP
ncbi:hypothetical protein WR25_18191 [Diploscapter pachys]|uniref:C-type lectin domain-containing protein n=1 Tax=Diploscapter pachys TaxID=2018661 RepID=A0A2A2JI07_9BILA|nr:hypothetical protein WR25_18191 [Diploscapter pachys]